MAQKINTSDTIHIKGARLHNLKNIEVQIPRNQFIVITGVSGSGKSTLAFDTLYAEGQRRYVESLSSYARQFLGRINKPEVDFIKGIPPAIAIEQKVNTRNPRSTVGTSTEVYDYMKLLFARIGKTYSPISGEEVKKHDVTDVVDFIFNLPPKTKLLILCPIYRHQDRTLEEDIAVLFQQGFTRIELDGEVLRIDDGETIEKIANREDSVHLVIDRIAVKDDEDTISRAADSIQSAFNEGGAICIIQEMTSGKKYEFSHTFEADGITFEEPTADTFSFNNPLGACPECEGYGKVIGIDRDLVIPNKNLSIFGDAIVCWKGEKTGEWKHQLINNAFLFNFPIHKPYIQLTKAQQELLWTGNKHFEGLDRFFKYLEEKAYKIQNRVMLARYRGRTTCHVCHGTRLKPEASYIKIQGMTITELVDMPISELQKTFNSLKLDSHDFEVAKRLLKEIQNRLEFLCDVGLGYLTLNRLSSSLSGGESQRINLATSLGSSLVGSIYILDEPSIGLHSHDTERLIKVLRKLQQLGNTVLVVEHDEDIMRAADHIIDIGPLAGIHGGQITFEGTFNEALTSENSLTGKYLSGREQIETPKIRRKWKDFVQVEGARANNLQNINVKIPLHSLTAISGVSGSGKSTLIKQIFYPAVIKHFGAYGEKTGEHDNVSGDIDTLHAVEFIDQNPIGKSSRSNPVTYLKAYDEVRKLYSTQKSAKYLGLKPAHFSFNVDGGRCDECQGEGEINVEMQFMADVKLICESCNGKRFKEDVLDVKFKGKSIFDILELPVNQAIDFFGEEENDSTCKKIVKKLKPLQDVGLGYVKLGQSSSTLSGGESQRVKLASFLAKERDEPTLFIFDEPTTGLHFNDIKKLLTSLNALIDRGHSVVVIEHNLDVIKSADWVIDLGPGGGDKGGKIVAEGTPESLSLNEASITGIYLKAHLSE